jgi:hypothetical protein
LRYSKVAILQTYWNKIINQIGNFNLEHKNQKVYDLLKSLFAVPKEVQEEVLRAYLEQCRKLHKIAFCQWRIKFPSKVKVVMEEVEELVQQDLYRIY